MPKRKRKDSKNNKKDYSKKLIKNKQEKNEQ